jgi:Domain of unknown function (DUF6265)
MVFVREWRTNACTGVRAFGALRLLVLVLTLASMAVGMRAQQATGAGTPSAPEPLRAADPTPAPTLGAGADSAAASEGGSSRSSSNAAAKVVKPDSVATPQVKATLADFAWLAGRWQGAWGPRVAQQVWMPSKAGVMLGTFQLVDNGDTLVIELFTLVEKPDGIDLYFRHFTPALAPWETSKPTLMKLVSSTPKLIEFDNPVDGEPKRAIIRRIDADTYISRSEIVPDKGDPQVIEITYHRQKEISPAKH